MASPIKENGWFLWRGDGGGQWWFWVLDMSRKDKSSVRKDHKKVSK